MKSVQFSLREAKRWKQALIAQSAIYPPVMLVPFGMIPLLRLIGLLTSALVDTLVTTGTIVLLMT